MRDILWSSAGYSDSQTSLFQLKKVFTVVGPYPVIRDELRARGWVERHLSSTAERARRCHGNEMDCGEDGGRRAGETVFRGQSLTCQSFNMQRVHIILKYPNSKHLKVGLLEEITSHYVCWLACTQTTYLFAEIGDGGVKEEKLENMQALMVNERANAPRALN